MDWSAGVATAIARARADNTPLLVLVEPAAAVLQRAADAVAPEPPASLHDRLATRALHDKLFARPAVLTAVRDSHACCLRFNADKNNPDFVAFSSFFSLTDRPPNLFLIAPASGLVLYRLSGYVSPNAFLRALRNAVLAVSNKTLDIPEPVAAPSASNPVIPASPVSSSAQPATPTKTENKPAAQTLETPAPTAASAQTPSAARALKLPGAPSSSPEPENTRLRARLPSGDIVSREFGATATFSAVRAWAAEAIGAPPRDVVVATAFPQRRVFGAGEDGDSVTSLGLVPSANLVVSRVPAAPVAPSRFASLGLGSLGLGSGLSLRAPGASATAPPPAPAQPTPARPTPARLTPARPAQPTNADASATDTGTPWRMPGVASTASSAASVAVAFLRSFVAAPGEDTGGATEPPPPQEEQRLGHGGSEEQGEALRMTTPPARGEQEGERGGNGDNLMSNGNSTQFGWNEDDFDDNSDGQTPQQR